MTNCCNTSENTNNNSKKHSCPVNGKYYTDVSITTIKHHIETPWDWQLTEQSYYFCDDPDCDVVYFGQDDSIIEKSSLRTRVGTKERSGTAMICYCFGISRDCSINNPDTKTFVIDQTRNHVCSCSTSNPSGRCCLKDFPD